MELDRLNIDRVEPCDKIRNIERCLFESRDCAGTRPPRLRLPEIKRTERKRKLSTDQEASTKAMFDRLKVKILAIHNVMASLAADDAGEVG